MKKLILVIILFLSAQLAECQNSVDQLLNKADVVYDENPAESFSLCESAERKANETGDHSQDGHIAICKARYFVLIAKYDAAGKELNQAIMTFERDNDLHSLANAYKLKNILLQRIGDYDEAHKMLLKSLDLYRQLDDERGIVNVLINLSLDYSRNGQTDSMLVCLEEMDSRMVDAEPSRYYYLYQNWGTYYMITEDFPRAVQQYELALKVSREEKMTDSEATCLMLLSTAYQAIGDLAKADQLAEESYNFSEENNLVYESYEALEQWIKVKEARGDIKQAYEIQKKWIRVKNEIHDLERIRKVKAIESQLELAEKEKQIAESEIALQKSKVEGQREKTKNTRLIGIIAVVFILLTFTILIYLRTRKLNKEINEQKEIVELKSLHLEEALDNIEDSLHYSKMIQSSMLPSQRDFDKISEENFILYRPKDIVSGDFYWMHDFDKYQIIVVGDCTGHGVPGAMVSMVCNEALNKVFIEQNVSDPAQGLDKVRDIVVKTFKRNENEMSDGMDVSVLKIQGQSIQYAGANNNIWIFRDKKNELPTTADKILTKELESVNLIEIKADKQPVGHYFNPKPFETKTVNLAKGDKVYLFSDGYADQFGGDKGKKLKASNLKNIIGNAFALKMKDQHTHLVNIFDEWKGELEQLDDVCIIGLKLT